MSAHAKNAPPLRFDNPPLRRMTRPPAISLVELGVVGVSLVFGLFAPALVVSPAAHSAPAGRVALAAGLTALGALVAMATAFVAFRRTRNFSWMVIGVVPTFTLMVCAVIMAGSKAGG